MATRNRRKIRRFAYKRHNQYGDYDWIVPDWVAIVCPRCGAERETDSEYTAKKDPNRKTNLCEDCRFILTDEEQELYVRPEYRPRSAA